jgi:hypothetical protein
MSTIESMRLTSEGFGEFDLNSQRWRDTLDNTRQYMGDGAAAALEFAASANNAAAQLQQIAAHEYAVKFGDEFEQRRAEADADYAARAQAKHGGAGKGSGHTNITVNMTISSNQAPGQIAKHAIAELAALRRSPRSSPMAPNYSAVQTTR